MTIATRTATSIWKIDKTHSNVDFTVKHLMISTVRGHFREFDATIELDEANPENSRVTATIDVASIDTNVPDRDAHLRSDDFFNAEEFPKITFESTKLERHGETEFRLTGTSRSATSPAKSSSTASSKAGSSTPGVTTAPPSAPTRRSAARTSTSAGTRPWRPAASPSAIR